MYLLILRRTYSGCTSQETTHTKRLLKLSRPFLLPWNLKHTCGRSRLRDTMGCSNAGNTWCLLNYCSQGRYRGVGFRKSPVKVLLTNCSNVIFFYGCFWMKSPTAHASSVGRHRHSPSGCKAQLIEHIVSLRGMDSLVCRGLYSILVLGFFLSLNIVTKETEEKILV